jgi:hypothetical protein
MMTRSCSVRPALLLAGAAWLVCGAAQAQYTLLTSRVNGDDQFKIYLSTQIGSEGYQYHNGWGWPITYTNTLWLPQVAANQNYKDYWLYIWVQDVGGGGPDLLGEFRLSGKPGCKFDNGTAKLLTGAVQSNGVSYWSVTPALPWSVGGPPVAGYPTPFTNYLPPFKQPTQIPADLGANGVPPWGPMPLINVNAHWISDPATTSLSEAWFGAHIRCK